MRSLPFQQLASSQGVPGIDVGDYTSQFLNLRSFVTVDKGTVGRPGG